MRSYRWAWFVLACLTAAALVLTLRYQYAACDTDGCVVVDRWTGDVRFQETEEEPGGNLQGTVVRARVPERAGPAAAALLASTRRGARSRPTRSSRAARSR